VDAKGPTEAGYWYEANNFRTAEHGGTHLDAPVHFARDKTTADQVPLSRLVGPAVVVDVTEACGTDRDYQVRIDDLVLFEIAEGATATALFTRNRFRAAPVRLAEQHLGAAAPRYLLINTGNANAGTGRQGDERGEDQVDDGAIHGGPPDLSARASVGT